MCLLGLTPILIKVVYISNFRPAAAAAAPFGLKLSQTLATEIEIYQVVREVAREEQGTPLKG